MQRLRNLALVLLASSAASAIELPNGKGCVVTGLSNTSPPVLTCAAAPGWTAGRRIRLINIVVNTNVTYDIAAYVNVVTSTTFSLYQDAPRTVPYAAPGVFVNHGAIKFAAPLTDYTADLSRPRLFPKTFIENFRCDVERGCLTNIVVSGGVATANFARTGTYPHEFLVGGGVGVWGSATSALNTEAGVVTAVTANTVQWNTAAANGTYTDAAVSSRAFTANFAWQWTKAVCSAYSDFNVPGNNQGYTSRYVACALVYYIDRSNTTAKTRANWIIDNVVSHVALGTTHCLENDQIYCDGRDDAVDYSRLYTPGAMQVYDLLKAIPSEISSPRESTYMDMLLTSRDNSPGCVNQPFVQATGTITASGGGTTITGVGTNFTSFAVGGIIWPVYASFRDDANISYITAISSNTSMTVSRPITATGLSPSTTIHQNGWTYYRPWQAGDCGARFLAAHHNVGTVGNPAVYAQFSNVFSADWFISNLAITSGIGEMSIALGFLGETPFAVDIMQRNYGLLENFQLAATVEAQGDATPMGTQYGFYGRASYLPKIEQWKQNIFPTSFNRTGGYWMTSSTRIGPWGYSGGLNSVESSTGAAQFQAAQSGEFAGFKPQVDQMGVFEAFTYMTLEEKRAWMATLARACGVANAAAITTTCFNLAANTVESGIIGWPAQLIAQPLDLTTLPKARITPTSSAALCNGALSCGQDTSVMGEAVFRDSWSITSPVWSFLYGGSYNDHYWPGAGQKWLRTNPKANTVEQIGAMYGTDNPGTNGALSNNPEWNSFLVPGTANWRRTIGGQAPPTHYGQNSEIAWLSVEYAATFSTPLTKAVKRWVYYNKAGDPSVLIEDSHAIQPSPGLLRDLNHFIPNGRAGSGTTTCAGSACAVGTNLTANIISDTADTRLEQNTVFPAGGAIRRIDLANGDYPGSGGKTFRLTNCSSSDGTTCATNATSYRGISAFKTSPISGAVSMTMSALTATNWAGTTVVSGGVTMNTLFSDSDQTSMPPVTLPAGKFAAVGLSPGTYDVYVNNVLSQNDIAVASPGKAIYVGALGAGSVDIRLDGAPPPALNLDTTTLPAGTVGVAYTPQSLSASGGTPPYTFTCPGCSLPAGMTYSGNVLSGTPSVAGTYNLTFRVDDSASGFDTQPISFVIDIGGGSGGPGSITPRTSRIRGSRVRIK